VKGVVMDFIIKEESHKIETYQYYLDGQKLEAIK
jgi:hypothetical protein